MRLGLLAAAADRARQGRRVHMGLPTVRCVAATGIHTGYWSRNGAAAHRTYPRKTCSLSSGLTFTREASDRGAGLSALTQPMDMPQGATDSAARCVDRPELWLVRRARVQASLVAYSEDLGSSRAEEKDVGYNRKRSPMATGGNGKLVCVNPRTEPFAHAEVSGCFGCPRLDATRTPMAVSRLLTG